MMRGCQCLNVENPDVNDISVQSKFEDLGNRIEAAIASGNYEKISAMANKVKEYRQAGLDAHGEFGAENLAFKILRKQGLIQKLYDARAAAKDQQLSLDERKKKKKKVRYGYGGYWYPGTAYAGQDQPAGTEGGGGDGGGGESFREDAGMTWDGVNPTTDMFTSEDAGMTPSGVSPTTAMFTTETDAESDEQILRDFVGFCVDQLNIKRMPRVKLRRDPEWCRRNRTFGRYNDNAEMLEVAWGNRHIMDVLRTVAHELTHKSQHEREAVPADAGETGSAYENEANAKAGILMRAWAQQHPEHFGADSANIQEQLDENLKSTAGTVAVLTCLLAGGGLTGCATAPQQTHNRFYVPHRMLAVQYSSSETLLELVQKPKYSKKYVPWREYWAAALKKPTTAISYKFGVRSKDNLQCRQNHRHPNMVQQIQCAGHRMNLRRAIFLQKASQRSTLQHGTYCGHQARTSGQGSQQVRTKDRSSRTSTDSSTQWSSRSLGLGICSI
jgi:hypothetical protein